jgi:hypothetical protein
MIDLLMALRDLGPLIERTRDTSPESALLEHLVALEAARADALDAIACASVPRSGTPVGDLVAARERFARRRRV